MQIVWIVVLVLAVIAEALTTELVAIWFFPAAIVALVLAFFEVSPLVQTLVFLAVGLVLVFSTRPLCRRFARAARAKTNADALIGERGLVTEEIDNDAERGEVKINGLCWSARAEGGEVIPMGALVTIVEIRGVKLIVKQQ